eukprot:scaffold146216_cov31-Tisochrysis_lutea.AAC.2
MPRLVVTHALPPPSPTPLSGSQVRLPVEDRDELKGYILAGEAYFSVSRSDGEACTLALKSQGVVVQSQQSATDPAVHHRIAATWADASFHANRQSARGAVLRWDPSREGARPDANAGSPTDDEAAEVLLLTEDERTRNLLMLTAQAFVSLTAEPSHRGACRVWEGDGYGMYIAELRGQVRSSAPASPFLVPRCLTPASVLCMRALVGGLRA